MTKARDIASAAPAPAGVTSTELGFVDGVTSAIQTQMDTKAATASTVSTAGGSTVTVSSGSTVPLTIQNDGTGNSFVVNDEPSDANSFVITADGSVGVGTSSPANKLESNGAIGWSQAVGRLTGSTPIAYIDSRVQDTGSLVFRTNTGGSSIDRMRIDNDGAVTINVIADATTTTAARGAGYMGIPQSAAAGSGAYSVVAADAGEHIYTTTTRTVTIPANSALALPIGTALTFISGVGAVTTIAITTDTMYLAGAGTTGSRTLAAHGMATAVKVAATTWYISGNGLS